MTSTDPAALPPTETSRKDRRDLWASLTVFALTGAVVVYAYLSGLLRQLGDGVVGARVDFAAPAPVLTSPSGVDVSLASPGVLDAPVALLSPVSIGLLRTAEAFQSIGYLTVLALLAWMVGRFTRGHLFDDRAVRLVWLSSVAAIVTIVVPQFPRTLGTNLVIRDLQLSDTLNAAPLGPEFWYGYVFCMALSAVAVAVRLANRLARDTDGLV